MFYCGISADFLSDIVSNLSMGDDGIAYVLDNNGNVIGHPDRSLVGTDSNMIELAKSDPSVADIAAVNKRMVARETGFGAYNFNGDNKLVGFAPIDDHQHWSIAIEASQREFKASLDQSIMLTVLVVVLVVLACYPVAVQVGRSISNPIQICIERLEKMSQGDVHTPAPKVNSKDETARLAKMLETMISYLNNVAQDVSYHLGKMAQGDFREEITKTYLGDFASIEKSMKMIHSSLKDALTQISQSAGTVANGAVQVSSGA